MINRILIRIKVVQMLYSYLLTRSEFRILPSPEKNTRDSRFAYSLYLQILMLAIKLSGCKTSPDDRIANPKTTGILALSSGEIVKALSGNSEIHESSQKRNLSLSDFSDILQYLVDEIAESGLYREFARKRNRDIKEEVNVWSMVFDIILRKNDKFIEACRKNPDFTIAGFEKGIDMAVETIRNYSDIRSTLAAARRSLQKSLDEAYNLYIALMALPLEITRLREEQIETAREKYLPTDEDLNPNLKFIDNKFVKALQSNELLKAFETAAFKQQTDYYLIKKLHDEIVGSQIYKDYMESGKSTFEEDCEFWRDLMKDIVFPSDALAEALENKSIFWNDDLAIVGQFVLKTIRRSNAGAEGEVKLMPMFKDEEDATFGEKLFISTIDHYKEYREIIDRFINPAQWDSERLALMDIVIMSVAITELLEFPLIPIAVTLNEYIEIANFYSNPRSGQFINGILYSIIKYLKEEGRLHKELPEKPLAD